MVNGRGDKARGSFLAVALVALAVALGVLTAGCGDDSEVEAGDGPIPVEPDGGIGDGAGPPPGAEDGNPKDPADGGTWHGAEVAETNCPGTTWKRVEASDFSFSVPTDFVDQTPQGVDSEVGEWSGDQGIDVYYDYGWYSGSMADTAGATVEAIDYSGITGTQTIVTGDPNQMQVFFDEVEIEADQPNLLALNVTYAASADEIIARCIVGSIEWTLG